MTAPLVITVILNTNRREDTLACLASLEETTYSNHRVIVLDNASSDGSVDAIRGGFSAVEIIQLKQNLGYAGNNNVGIEAALLQGADWIFVLNEDTIVAPDCIKWLIETAALKESLGSSRVGILGPKVYHASDPNLIQSAGGKLTNRWTAIHVGQNEDDQGQFEDERQVDWISGCALLVKNQVIQESGSLDARFFYYWEETDWCKRATEHGWQIWFVPKAKIWHKGVQKDYAPSPNVTYYNTRNRLLFMAKHHAPLTVWISVLGRTMLTLTSWTMRPKWREMRPHRDAMWQGISDFCAHRWGMRSNVIARHEAIPPDTKNI